MNKKGCEEVCMCEGRMGLLPLFPINLEFQPLPGVKE